MIGSETVVIRNCKESTIDSQEVCLSKSKRKIHLDILRIIACFLVIVNHTNSRIFLSMEPSMTWFLSLLYFFVCKIAVPIFIMISGAVLLGKQESYKEVFKKRILKTVLVIVAFSLVYYISSIDLETFSISDFLYKIWKGPITNAYWYLYMYLGLLVMLPLLRKMLQNMEKKDYIYYSIVWIIFIGTLPIINHYLNIKQISSNFSVPIFTSYIAYFIIGYFIENKLEKKFFNKKIAIILIILSILCIGVSISFTYYEKVNEGTLLFMDNISFITISIPSITMFYICKYVMMKFENRINGKIVTKVATCTFGIYLLSDLLIKKFEFVYTYMINYVHKLLAIFILEIIVFAVGFVITMILKRIPLIKKIL